MESIPQKPILGNTISAQRAYWYCPISWKPKYWLLAICIDMSQKFPLARKTPPVELIFGRFSRLHGKPRLSDGPFSEFRYFASHHLVWEEMLSLFMARDLEFHTGSCEMHVKIASRDILGILGPIFSCPKVISYWVCQSLNIANIQYYRDILVLIPFLRTDTVTVSTRQRID